MRSSVTIGRIAGIDIGIHSTWLIAVALISWSLAGSYFPSVLAGQGLAVYWLMGIAGALLLFGSVLVHELSHSLVARRRGLRVDSITLFVFGGVSNLSTDVARPSDELLVAAVGPATSLAIAAVCGALVMAVPGLPGVIAALLGYTVYANAILGVFNLVPGFPLDGGRVLRGIVWATTHSLRQATRVASYVGQAIGYALIFVGVWLLFDGDLVGGLWIGLIGWFLNSAAEATRQEQAVREVLSGVPVARIMDPAPLTMTSTESVEAFVFEKALRRGERAAFVVDDGRLVGVATLQDVKKVERALWPTTPLRAVMTSVPLKVVGPASDLTAALELMAANRVHQLPVVDGERIVGVVTRETILSVLQVRDELGSTPLQPTHA